MSKTVKAVFALGVIGLAIGFLVPTLMGATQDDARATHQLYVNDSVELTDRLTVTLTDINETEHNATFKFLDETNYQNSTVELTNYTSRDTTLSGNNLTVSVAGVTSVNDTVRTTIDYPPMFQWSDGARSFMSNIGLIIILIAGIMLLAVFALIMRED